MNDKNNVNVAVIARFEENEEDFIKLVASEDHKINFVNIKDDDVSQKVKKSIESTDKIILLVNSIDGVTPKLTEIIKEIVKNKVVPIVVLNEVGNSDSTPYTVIEEINHVLVMENATDEQLEFSVIYFDDENKTATLDLVEETKDLNELYKFIIK